MIRSLRWRCCRLLALPPCPGAGLEIDIVGGNAVGAADRGGADALPGRGPPPETDVAAVIRADLNRSGQFRALPRQDIVERPTRGSEVKYPTWRVLQAGLPRRRPRARCRRRRLPRRIRAVRRRQAGAPARLRADRRAPAPCATSRTRSPTRSTRRSSACAARSGPASPTSPPPAPAQSAQYALMVADSDGFNPQTVVRSPRAAAVAGVEPGRPPPGLRQLRARQLLDLHPGHRAPARARCVARFRGINGAPAFSPDGRRLALTLSHSGNPEIYVMDLGSKAADPGHQPFRHRHRAGLERRRQHARTSPPTAAASRRSTRCRPAAASATRVTFQGEIQRQRHRVLRRQEDRHGAGQRQHLPYRGAGPQPRRSRLERRCRRVTLDESPSFAPNASMMLYAAREGRRGVLYAVSADGRVRQRLVLADGDVREPAWGPFRQR